MSNQPHAIPEGVRRDIIRRYDAGESAQSIATDLKLAKTSVYNVLRKTGTKLARTMHTLSDGQETEIIARYAAGESVHSISKDYAVHLQTIHNMLHRRGVADPNRTSFRLATEARSAVVVAAKAGSSVSDIARDFGVSETTVSKTLRKARAAGDQIVMLQGRPPVHEVDDTAFDILTPDALYWMGFIFTDGCVYYGKGTPRLVVGLGEKDRGHLEKLRAFLKTTHPIRLAKATDTSLGGNCVYLNVRSTRICEVLTKRGIVTKRTRTPSPDLAASRDFWRGTIDGDGWITISKHQQKYLYVHVGLCGQMTLLSQFQNFLARDLGIELRISAVKQSGIWKIDTSGSTAKDIVRHLWAGATTFLDRKNVRAGVIMSGNLRTFPAYDDGPSAREVAEELEDDE